MKKTLLDLLATFRRSLNMCNSRKTAHLGLEPRTFSLEGRRAIHCAREQPRCAIVGGLSIVIREKSKNCSPGTRTQNLLLRRETRYPLRQRAPIVRLSSIFNCNKTFIIYLII